LLWQRPRKESSRRGRGREFEQKAEEKGQAEMENSRYTLDLVIIRDQRDIDDKHEDCNDDYEWWGVISFYFEHFLLHF
jgi:hypothetical protein